MDAPEHPNRPVHLLGKPNIIPRRPHVVFADLQVAGVLQHLVDAAATHHVSAQKQP
jgi:hypothetical protein